MSKDSNKKVLIVEDEAAMQEALASKFVREGFDVIQAMDGEEAYGMAKENNPDIILMDIIMPKMDGMSVMKLIREEKWGAEIPIIMLTNLSDPNSASEAVKYGVYDFLVKTDWKLDDVVSLVKDKLYM